MTDDHSDFGDIDPSSWDALARAATQVRERAYVPYSHFPVGAALLTDSDEVVAGCNVENATFGATVCAERTAIAAAVATGRRRFKALAVITDTSPPSAPCGICRQVLAEFCDELPILLLNPSGDRHFTTLNELLPLRFSGRDFLEE